MPRSSKIPYCTTLFIVCEHKDKVQHGPDGSHIGTKGIFIPEGRRQVNDQERAAGSKHAVDDARAEKDRNGNPVRKGCTGRFQEKIFKRHADNEKSVHRHKNTGVHNIVEINTGRHADKHEENDASQFFLLMYSLFLTIRYAQTSQQITLMTALAMSGP